MIEPEKALRARMKDREFSWTTDDVILYHLGLGAGVPPTDERELEYVYEGRELKVLPSFSCVPALYMLDDIDDVEGLEYDVNLVLHGEQDLIVHAPLPSSGAVRSSGRITELWDKGKAALCVFEVETRNAEDDQLLATNRFSLFLRGAGGFGGERGPKTSQTTPERAPDGVIERTLLPQQALIYRLSGDKNPVHADPELASKAGFDRPIIHGLCSYGMVLKAVVDELLEGRPERVARWSARFADVGFPGDTYAISYWREGERIEVHVAAKDRDDAPILANAAITTVG
jgi:acyl dehydratase